MGRSWIELAATWPWDAGQARERRAVQALVDGDYLPVEWEAIRVQAVGHELIFAVGQEPWRIGNEESAIDGAVSHWGAQKVADAAGWTLGTPRLHDAVTAAARDRGTFVDAGAATAVQIWGPGTVGAPSSILNVFQASVFRDALGIRGVGLVAGPWKEWVSDARLLQPAQLPYRKAQAVNYGFWTLAKATAPPTPGPRPSATDPSLRVWQRPGLAHDFWHSDYSQLLRPIWPDGWVEGPRYPEGAFVPLEDLAKDAELWRLVRSDAPGTLRHPWIPREGPVASRVRGGWPTVAAVGVVSSAAFAAAVAYEVIKL